MDVRQKELTQNNVLWRALVSSVLLPDDNYYY